MGTTSDKLTYLAGTKSKLKDAINYTGANITNDTFRSYPEKLYNQYIDILNNGTDTLYSNMPKVSGTGSTITLNGAKEAPMEYLLGGNTYQQAGILPSEYQQVEYIQSSGTQYINTGLVTNSSLPIKFEVKFEVMELNKTHSILGSASGSNNRCFVFDITSANKLETGYKDGYNASSTTVSLNTIYEVESYVSDGSQYIKLNGTEVLTATRSGTLSNTNNLYLFTRKTDSSVTESAKVRIYSAKIYVNGVLTRDFIPCYKVSDTTIGMYDLVNNTFYSNVGSGAFTKGNNTLYPTPDYPMPIESATGRQEINVCGKNLFDYTTSAFSNPSNVNITTVNNTITITTTTQTTSNNLFFYTRIPDEYLENGATYTISSENVSGVYRSLKLQLRNKNGSTASKPMVQSLSYDNNYALYIVENPFAESGSTTVPQGTTVVIKNVQVEKNSSATTYEPYQGITQEINLGKNLFDINQSEVSVLYATITINGNELTQKNSSTDAYSQSNWFIYNLIVGETYHVNCEFTNTNGCTLRLNMYDRNDTLINRTDNTTATSGTLSLTFVATDTTCKMRLYSNNTSTANSYSVIFNNIQLEKGNQSTSYSAYFEPIKLNKIGNYQDYLFYNEESSPYYNIELQKNRWYIHKEIGKVVLNGSESWADRLNYSYADRFVLNGVFEEATMYEMKSNYFVYDGNLDNTYPYISKSSAQCVVNFSEKGTTTLAQYKTWLSTHNTIVYYVLATPTNTEITNATLINQLEGLLEMKSRNGQTNIIVTSADLPILITASAIKEYE